METSSNKKKTVRSKLYSLFSTTRRQNSQPSRKSSKKRSSSSATNSTRRKTVLSPEKINVLLPEQEPESLRFSYQKNESFRRDSLNDNINPKLKNTHFIFVNGLGCNQIYYDVFGRKKKEAAKNIVMRYSQFFQIPKKNIHTFCDLTVSALKQIINIHFKKTKLKHENFDASKIPYQSETSRNEKKKVKSIIEKILEKENSQIIITGFSYGGGLVSKLAIELNNELSHDKLDRISFFTFGSIFIPPKEITSNVHILHCLPLGDVAMKLNNIKEPKNDFELKFYDETKNILWVNYLDKTKKHKRGILFGSSEEWKVHTRDNGKIMHCILSYVSQELNNQSNDFELDPITASEYIQDF